MIIKRIKSNWWVLKSDNGVRGVAFFGYSRKQVLGKFQSYIREYDLERIRVVPKNLREVAV